MAALLPAFEFQYVDRDDAHLPPGKGGHKNPKTPRLKKQIIVVRAATKAQAEKDFKQLYPRYTVMSVTEAVTADLSTLSALSMPARKKAKKAKEIDPRSVEGFKSYVEGQSNPKSVK